MDYRGYYFYGRTVDFGFFKEKEKIKISLNFNETYREELLCRILVENGHTSPIEMLENLHNGIVEREQGGCGLDQERKVFLSPLNSRLLTDLWVGNFAGAELLKSGVCDLKKKSMLLICLYSIYLTKIILAVILSHSFIAACYHFILSNLQKSILNLNI